MLRKMSLDICDAKHKDFDIPEVSRRTLQASYLNKPFLSDCKVVIQSCWYCMILTFMKILVMRIRDGI